MANHDEMMRLQRDATIAIYIRRVFGTRYKDKSYEAYLGNSTENPEYIKFNDATLGIGCFTGKTGAGKTVLACHSAYHWWLNHNKHEESLYYSDYTTYFNELKGSMGGGEKFDRRKVKNAGYLILDDCFIGKLSDFEMSELQTLVIQRENDCKKTLLITNQGYDNMKKMLPDTIFRRIDETHGFIVFK